MSRFRLFLEWIAILAGSLALAWWAGVSGVTGRLDNQILDFVASRAAPPVSDDILLATIDDGSLGQLGKWPWDRKQIARLVDNLSAGGARLIVLDVLFTEPAAPDADAALANSIAASGKVALPYTFTPAKDRTSGVDLLQPVSPIREAAATSGHVALEPDADGVVRRMALRLGEGGGAFPHLAVAAYSTVHGKPPPALTQEAADALPPIVPLHPAGAYRRIPAAAILNGEVPPAFTQGKVVIFGATAPGLGDTFPVSAQAGAMMSGAELQANLYQALGDDSFIHPLDSQRSFLISAAVILLMFLGFWRLKPAFALVLAMTLVLGLLSLSLFLARRQDLWFASGPAMLALLVAYPLWGWRRLAAVSGFLEAEASKLEPVTGKPGVGLSLGGFDSVAKQVSRLEFLVDEVSERRAFLVRVIEATPDAMCVFGKDGGLLLMNARARALFGAENIGLALNDLIIAVRGRFNDDHNEIALDDGRSFAVTSSAGEEHGEWDGIQIFVFTDITDIRRAEADRRRMLEFLSHDMRSPQVAILGLTSDQAGEHEDADRFDRIRAHARRTMKLADDFVQLARLAEAPLRLVEADLAALADEALDRAWPLARQKRVSLKRALPDDAIMVSCDPDILSRVLDNLIGNAIKYGDEGGEVSVEVREDDDGHGRPAALLAVTDNGPGLPEERHADPFKRFGSRGSTDQPGAGLGLAFVQAAIERHEASITWQSAPGAGTRFAIAFSLLANAPEAEADETD